MKNLIKLIISLLLISMVSRAQVAEYFFIQVNSTYTEITGGTALWSGTFNDEVSGEITIPSFTYDGSVYTSLYISANGFITFGSAPTATNYTPISNSATYNGAISGFGRDLNQAATGSPAVRYEQVGNEFVIQWKDVRRKDIASEVISFQVRLNTSNNYISVIYGGTITPGTNTTYPQVGLRGPDNTIATNIHNRTIAAGGGNWINSTKGTSSSSTMYFNITTPATVPTAGLTYTWKPLYNPTDFTAEAISQNQIDLDWLKNSLNHNVMLAYNTTATFGTPVSGTTYAVTGTIGGGGTVLVYGGSTSYTHTGLSANTRYYYKIWSYDAVPDYSIGDTVSARTAIALPYLQDFNGSSAAGWSHNMALTTGHGTAGTKGLAENLSSGSAYAITPLIGSMTASTNLSFHYRIVNALGFPLNATTWGPSDKIEIQVSLDDGATFSTIHTIDQNNHTATTEFTNKVISLAAYSGDYIKIRFLCTWGSGDYWVDFDNVLFEDGTNMTYSGATTDQFNFTNVAVNSTNNDIIRLQVVTQKSSSPLSVTSITFNTTGCTNAGTDLASAKVYYTTTPVFSTATLFGTFTTPSGPFSVTGTQALAQGNNYFWLAYDIKPTATLTNLVDAQCTKFITSESGSDKIPTVTTITGTRKIGAVISSPKSIPTDYATIALAVTALNNGVIGSGGVTFNVAAGHTESSGAAIVLTQTGTSADPIIFQKSGSGANPLVTRTDAGSVNTTTLGNHGDGVIIIEGSDYVTFDGIDLTATNSGVEYGYYLRKASVTDGCKNVTVKNTNITMTKGTSAFVVGFCAANNSSSLSNIAITTTGGIHDAITFTGNLISNTFCGIYLKGNDDFKDQNFIIGSSGFGNTIRNFGGNSANATYGIYIINNDNPLVKYNTINNMTGGGSAFTAAASGIHHASAVDLDFTAEYNNINLTSAAASAVLYGIYSSVYGVLQLNYNTIALSNTTSSSAVYSFIHNLQSTTPSTNNITINNNSFAASSFQTTGNTHLIYNNNQRLQPSVTSVQNNSVTGTINRTGTSGAFYLYYNSNGNYTGTENISGNDFTTIVLAGSTSFWGIYSTLNANGTQNLNNNTISNITCGSSHFYAFYLNTANNKAVYENQIFNITGGGNMTGMYLGGGDPANIYKNEIYNLSSSSTSTTAGVVNGILVVSGTNVYIYNNFISDLKTPLSPNHDAIRGMSISTGFNSTTGVYYNTIYLNATSSGADFGTTGLYHISDDDFDFAKLDLRNNLIINNSTPNGAASTIAFRRSFTPTENYATTSNNNIFYAGPPSSKRLIYWGNTTMQTMEEYRDFIGPNRDSVSFSELPPFTNITTAPYDLRLLDGTTNYCESGAQPITTPITISDDFDGAVRPSTPDIGADEFAGISAYVEKTQAFTASSYNSQQIKLDFIGNSYNDDIVVVFNLTGTFTDPSGTPLVGQPLAGGTVAYVGTVSPFIHTGLTPGITVYYKIFCYNAPFYSIGRKANAIPLVPPVTNLSATEASQTQIDLVWTKNASDHNVMIASRTSSPSLGTPVNGTSYEVGNSIPDGGTVIYKGPASGFSHTGLTQWTQYYYRAWSYDSFNYYSVFAPKNAVTDSDPVTLPYLQNFDALWSHFPDEPPAWRVIDADGGGMSWMRSTTSPHSAPASARGYEYQTANDYLISPPLVLPDTAIQLTWWDITTNSSPNSYKVLLSTTTKAISSFTVELGDYNCTNNSWEQRSISLGAYNNQTVYIAFYQYYSTASGENFRIDDVFIETRLPGPAANPMPSDDLLTMVNPTLKWTAPLTSFPILGYKVYYGSTSNPSTLIYDGPDQTFQMEELDYNSTYYWKVVPYNSYGEAINVPVWSFTTVTSTQLAESFEGGNFPPAGWSYRNGWSASTTVSYHGTQSARGTNFNISSWFPFLITPLLEIEPGDNLEFFERATSTTVFNYFRIYYSDDKVDWTEFVGPEYFTKAAWGHQVIDLTPLAGNNYYLAIETWWSSSSYDYIYIDHVTGPDVVPVLPAPATNPVPVELADYISVTPTLGWADGYDGGIPTGYKVYLDTDTNATTLIYNGPDPYYQTSTLLNDTTYYWKVVPYNIVGDAPNCPVWSFTTIPDLAVQIGTGNSVYPGLPVSVSADYSYTQTLYLQPEIDIPGNRISKIYYEYHGGGGGGPAMAMSDAGSFYKDWVIYMGHTVKSDFNSDTAWVPFEDLTEVFNGEVNIPDGYSWVEITLDVPFEYNNTDNLVIAVDENTLGYANSEVNYFYGTDTTVLRALVYEDYLVNPDPENPPVAGAQVYGFANIRIQMEGIPTVPILRVNPTSKNFGYVILENESTPQTFTIRNNGVDTLTINSIALTGTDDDQFQLTDTNDYPADLAAYEAIVVNVTFNPTTEGPKTASLSIAHSLGGSPAQVPLSGNGLDPVIDDFPFTETFEDDSPFRVLWTQIQESGTGLWTYDQGADIYYSSINEAHGGVLNARFTSTPDGNITKLVSPVFDLTSVTDPHLVFWYGQEYMDPNQNELIVYYRTASDQSWIEIFSDDQDKYQWTPKVLALPSPTATYQLAFEGIDLGGLPNVLDDITVGPPPEPEITITPTEYDFGNVLTETESYQQTFAIINLGPVLLTIDDVVINGTDADDFLLYDLNPYPVELDYGEWIEVNVTFLPGSEGAKTAALEITDDATGSPHQALLTGTGFSTTISIFPFTETFEDDSPSRDFWTQIQEYGVGLWTYANGAGGGSITDAHGGVLNARFTDIGDGDLTMLVSPVLDLTAVTNPQVEFWYGQEAWDGDQNELYVYYRTASDQPWEDLFYDDTEKSQWTLQSLVLPNKSATYQIAFEGYDAYGYANVLDDVTVGPPTGLITTWYGDISSDWTDPDNWSDGVPGPGHTVIIENGTFDPIIDIDVTIDNITIEIGANVFVSPIGSLTLTGN